jgi:hypothetical protein
MGLISEDMIEKWILSKAKRGYKAKISVTKVVLLILKRMKTFVEN